jgi:hypothetical protein
MTCMTSTCASGTCLQQLHVQCNGCANALGMTGQDPIIVGTQLKHISKPPAMQG